MTAPFIVSATYTPPPANTTSDPFSLSEQAYDLGRGPVAEPGPAPNNDAIVAALNGIQVDHGEWLGAPRILYSRGTPARISVERAAVFNLDDPTNIVLTSSSMTHLQQKLRDALPGWVIGTPRLATPQDMQQTSTGTVAVLIHTQATTALQSQAPQSADIAAGFERYSRSPLAENGHWVGPKPRVVRQASAGANHTFAAWLYEWPDTPWVRANLVTLVEALQWAVTVGLREETQRRGSLFNDVRLVPWDAVTATSYNETINGPIAWWRSGQASVTRTETEFPGVTSTEYVENPIGPDTNLTHPGSNDPFAGLISAAKWIGGLGLAGLSVLYLGPAIGSLAKRAADRPSRRNPVGFVRASMLRKGEIVVWEPSSAAEAARFEGRLRIGQRGRIAALGVDKNHGMQVRFDNGVFVESMPIRELGIPSEMGFARPNPSMDTAETILRQMGGSNRLGIMIGAKDFTGDADSLTFKWASKAKNGLGAVTVKLNRDLYDMTFFKRKGWEAAKTIEGVYASELARIFQTETGLALSL